MKDQEKKHQASHDLESSLEHEAAQMAQEQAPGAGDAGGAGSAAHDGMHGDLARKGQDEAAAAIDAEGDDAEDGEATDAEDEGAEDAEILDAGDEDAVDAGVDEDDDEVSGDEAFPHGTGDDGFDDERSDDEDDDDPYDGDEDVGALDAAAGLDDEADDDSDDDTDGDEGDEEDEPAPLHADPFVEATDASFAELGLIDPLVQALQRLDIIHPSPVQLQAIPVLLSGRDLVASAPTGTGKTAAFLLPALQGVALTAQERMAERHARHEEAGEDEDGRGRRGKGRRPQRPAFGPSVLVLTPTRELAQQVTRTSHALSRLLPRTSTVCITGGASYFQQSRALSMPYEVLVATPGRLIDQLENGKIDLSGLKMLVLDEADRMLDMGFSDDVFRIAELLPKERQTVCFTATVSHDVRNLADKLLNAPEWLTVERSEEALTPIDDHVVYVDNPGHRGQLLRACLNDSGLGQAIVFTATKRHAEALTEELLAEGFAVDALHGDMNQRERTRALNRLRQGECQVLVATDVAARGIDVSTLTHVINFELPRVAEDYVHRIGRTGRAGASGQAISFVGREDVIPLRKIEHFLGRHIQVSEFPGLEAQFKPEPPKKRHKKKDARREGFGKGRFGGRDARGDGRGREGRSFGRGRFDRGEGRGRWERDDAREGGRSWNRDDRQGGGRGGWGRDDRDGGFHGAERGFGRGEGGFGRREGRGFERGEREGKGFERRDGFGAGRDEGERKPFARREDGDFRRRPEGEGRSFGRRDGDSGDRRFSRDDRGLRFGGQDRHGRFGDGERRGRFGGGDGRRSWNRDERGERSFGDREDRPQRARFGDDSRPFNRERREGGRPWENRSDRGREDRGSWRGGRDDDRRGFRADREGWKPRREGEGGREGGERPSWQSRKPWEERQGDDRGGRRFGGERDDRGGRRFGGDDRGGKRFGGRDPGGFRGRDEGRGGRFGNRDGGFGGGRKRGPASLDPDRAFRQARDGAAED